MIMETLSKWKKACSFVYVFTNDFRNIIKLIFINIIEGEDFKMDYYKTSIDAFTDIADRFDKVTKALLKKVFGTFK